MQPLLLALISGSIGVATGWAFGRRNDRTAKYLKDVQELSRELTSTTQCHRSFHATVFHCLRRTLDLAQAGEIDGVKSEVSKQIAVLYHTRMQKRQELAAEGVPQSEPEDLIAELQAVERDADRYPSLRAALAEERTGTS
jgi:cell division FtsZ-interacting protein ZapD